MSTTPKQQWVQGISFRGDVLKAAKRKAKSLNRSLSNYINMLVEMDLANKEGK